MSPAMLPRHVTEKVLERVNALKGEGYFSTNPDSVDGLPSFHLNLVSNGQALVAPFGENEEDKNNLDDFKLCQRDLLGLVEPYVYDELLPKVNQMMNSSSIIRVADIFLRRYGQDMTMMDGKSTRNGIAAHYDVFSRVTCVIALDGVAAHGTNGLFTTQVGDDRKTSNHAALRRFFLLACGDGVVHTWDVLHGVDVEPGLDRTSLVIWFTTEEELDPSSIPAPWLFEQENLEMNNVGQFVLASAIASSDESFRGDDSSSRAFKSPSEAMPQSRSYTTDKHGHDHAHDYNDSRWSTTVTHEYFDLYLDSAPHRENTFALPRLGSLCKDNMLDEGMMSCAKDLVCRLRPDFRLPESPAPKRRRRRPN